jgi:hypothetical protein
VKMPNTRAAPAILDHMMQPAKVVPAQGPFWVFCLAEQTMTLPDRDGDTLLVDRAYCERFASEYRRAVEHWAALSPDRPFYSPLLLEHGEEKDARRHGDVLSLAYAQRGERRGCWALIDPTPELRRDIAAGLVQYLSPHIKFRFEDADGEVFSPLLLELSCTVYPYLKRLGTILGGYELALSAARAVNTGENMEGLQELMDMLEEMRAAMETLAERVTELEAPAEEEAPADEDTVEAMADDDEEVEAASDDEEVEAMADDEEADAVAASSAQLVEMMQGMQAAITGLVERVDGLAASSRQRPLREVLAGGRPPRKESLEEQITRIATERGISRSEAAQYTF